MEKILTYTFLRSCLNALLLLIGLQLNAQIAQYTYEPTQGTVANPTPNIGSGSSSIVNLGGGIVTPGIRTGMAGTGCGTQNGINAWALEPFDPGSFNESNGAQFNTSTAGYQNISVSWDQRWSNTSPNTFRLQYTTNGSVWNNFIFSASNSTFCFGSINTNGCFETNSTGDIFRRIIVDFSSIAAVNNNPNFGIRVLASHYQSTGQFRQTSSPGSIAGVAGTWRFDNVTFSGTLLPGPTASIMSGTTTICSGGSANLKVTITGGYGPFMVVYSDSVSNFTVNNYISATNIPVNPVSTRTYTTVSITNANGVAGTGNSGSAVITVNPLPTVTATNITTCSTSALTLTGGSPAGGTYSIPNPYSGGNTTFTYTYTNPATGCTKTSNVMTFTRNVAPTITSQPSTAGQTQCQGSSFSPISITATGTATLTYQWYSNTTQSIVGGTSLTTAAHIANGSKTASYTPLSTIVGTLYYYVTVTNSCGSVKSTNATGAFIVSPSSIAGSVTSSQTICAGTSPSDLTLSGNSGIVVKWQKADDASFSIGLTDITVTSNILSGALIGNLTQTTYFRAVVQNGTCPTATSTAIQILVKSTTWTGSWSNGTPDNLTTVIFSADYSSTADLDACSVIVTGGNVTFNTGHTLIVQNGVDVAGGSLTFEEKASLIQVSNSANSGAINYKRNTNPVRKFDYTYWSSPVDMQILANLSPLTLSDKYFWWDTTIYNWASIVAPGITPMDIGKGYIIRAPQNFDPVIPSIFNGVFTGIPNNGDYIIPISVNGTNNLNLIGNPYPSSIDIDLFMLDVDNSTSIGTGTSVYLWTHNTAITGNNYSSSDYAVYNFSGGIGTAPAFGGNSNIPNGFIASGQAFMIKGLATGTATFKNSMRVAGNNDQFFRTNTAVEKNRLWIELKNDDLGTYRQALVAYIEGASNNADPAYDAEVMESGNPVSLYSIEGINKFSIQGKALPFNGADQILFGYKVSVPGTYLINLSDFDGLFQDQPVYLEDSLLGIIHDLKNSPYSFSTVDGTFDQRFVLRFDDPSLNLDHLNFGNQVTFYTTADSVIFNSTGTQIESVGMFDVVGRMIELRNVNSTTTSINLPLNHQVLIFKIVLDDGNITIRKISY